MRKRAYILLILCFCFHGNLCLSQLINRLDPDEYEKTLGELVSASEDDRARIMNDLALICAIDREEECFRYAEEARLLSTTQGNEKELGRALYNLGLYEHFHGTFTRALLYYYDAKEIFKKQELYEMEGDVHVQEILAYFGAGQYDAALDKIAEDEALICYRKAEAWEKQAIYLYGKGFFYNNYIRDYPNSLTIHKEALEICDSINSSSLLRGGIKAATGYVFSLMENEDSAVHYIHSSLDILDTTIIDDRLMMIQVTRELGSTHARFNNMDSAVYYLNRSKEDSRRFGYIYGIGWANRILGRIALEAGNPDAGINYFNEAVDIFKEIILTGNYFDRPEMRGEFGYAWDIASKMSDKDRVFNAMKSLRITLETLADAYIMAGQYGRALKAYMQLEEIRDSIYRWDQDREMKELLASYVSEQKESEIRMMKQEAELKELRIRNTRASVIGVGGGLLILIFIGFLALKQRKIKDEQRMRELEQKLLINQMNPHFMFNALTNIQGYMFAYEKKKARRYLDIFSELIRDTLHMSNLREVPIRRDIALITNYLALQKLRYGNKLNYTIEVDKTIDQDEILIPPSLIQPIVENAVEHGVKYLEGPGNVGVTIRKEPGVLVCLVEDSGVGREKAREIEQKRARKGKGMGITITSERLSALNFRNNNEGMIRIKDLYNEQGVPAGTLVTIHIPYKTRRY